MVVFFGSPSTILKAINPDGTGMASWPADLSNAGLGFTDLNSAQVTYADYLSVSNDVGALISYCPTGGGNPRWVKYNKAATATVGYTIAAVTSLGSTVGIAEKHDATNAGDAEIVTCYSTTTSDPLVYIDVWNLNGTAKRAQFTVSTYGGTDQAGWSYGITSCCISHITGAYYLLVYTVAWSGALFYKVFNTTTGTTVVGASRDLILMSNNIGFGNGAQHGGPFIVPTYADDQIVFLPPMFPLSGAPYNYSSIIPRVTGKVINLQFVPNTVELSDLLNRMG
jgi:hypothetical protein